MSYPPNIAVVGYGRAGKDTVGGWLGLFTPLKYAGSCSRVICPLIAKELGVTEEIAWADRHNNRQYWYEFANNYRKDDPTKIARKCLENGNIVVGLRADYELEACQRASLFDLVIWIDNPRVPVDPTATFTRNDADIVITNEGGYMELYRKVRQLLWFANIDVHAQWDCWDGPTIDNKGDWLGPLNRYKCRDACFVLR